MRVAKLHFTIIRNFRVTRMFMGVEFSCHCEKGSGRILQHDGGCWPTRAALCEKLKKTHVSHHQKLSMIVACRTIGLSLLRLRLLLRHLHVCLCPTGWLSDRLFRANLHTQTRRGVNLFAQGESPMHSAKYSVASVFVA